MTPIERAQAALDTLAALGTVEAIRDHLIEQGIRGEPGECLKCPVARYLEAVAKCPVSVAPGYCNVRVGPSGYPPQINVPGVVTEFIDTFDYFGDELDRNYLDPSWAPLYAEATP